MICWLVSKPTLPGTEKRWSKFTAPAAATPTTVRTIQAIAT